MDKDSLVKELGGVLDDPDLSSMDELSLAMLLHRGAEGDGPDRRLVSLLNGIRSEPDLTLFDGQYQCGPGQMSRLNYPFLAGWLIRRSRMVGAEQAVADIKRFLGTKVIPHRVTVALSGLEVVGSGSLGRGIDLVGWQDLPVSSIKSRVEQAVLDSTYPFNMPKTALVCWKDANIHHEKSPIGRLEAPFDTSEMHDAVLCLTIVGPSAPTALASWVEPAPWAPVHVAEIGFGMPTTAGVTKKLDAADVEKARVVYERFLNVSDPYKHHLRIPLSRLNAAMRRHSAEDSAIDLGIALEALFLSDLDAERGELTFRLRLRAARFLGGSLTERDEIYGLIGALYSLRSIAVHTGKLPEKDKKGVPVREVLERGYEITARALDLFIRMGEPDWKQIVFS